MAISLFSTFYEIASVVTLPRNDIVPQSPGEGRFLRGILCLEIRNELVHFSFKFLKMSPRVPNFPFFSSFSINFL